MDRLFTIAKEHLPNLTLIIASNRKILFANIAAIKTFYIIIGKVIALTSRHPGVLNAVEQTLASKTNESSKFSIPG